MKKFLCILVALGAFALLITLLSNNNSSDANTGDNPHAACIAYFKSEEGVNLTEAKLQEKIIKEFEDGGNSYLVMKDYTDKNDKNSLYVYILKIYCGDKKYHCDKFTPDLSLASHSGKNDDTNAPDTRFDIPVASKIVHVGIASKANRDTLDSNHQPLDDSGIYCFVD